MLSHFIPWVDATHDVGTFLEKYYLPFNVNVSMGQMIEKVMAKEKDKNIIVLAGHSHQAIFMRVSKNISCQVGESRLFKVSSQIIYL